MRTIFLLLLIVSAGLAAETVQLDNGNISFEAPAGFQALSEDVIRYKFPSDRRPRYVVGNANATTTIAYDLKPFNITGRVEAAHENFKAQLPRIIPNLVWIDQRIVELSGKKWGYLEMTSSAIDTDIHNIMLFTDYNNQMLVLNFNSTKEEFGRYEQALRASIRSIRVQ